MQATLLRLLNVLVTIISSIIVTMVIFQVIGLLSYFYINLTPGTASTFAVFTNPILPVIGAIIFLILLGSTVYYFKSNQPRMKLISSAGLISMILYALITYVLTSVAI